MAAPEHSPHSRRLQQAALAEEHKLSRELAKVERRLADLHEAVGEAEEKRSTLRKRLQLLTQLVGPSGNGTGLELVDVRGGGDASRSRAALRGAAIRTVAVRVLASSPHATSPIHYRAWLDLVNAAGFEISGAEPSASFLTQISRSPVVARAPDPGTYSLDFSAPQALTDRLTELRSELAALSGGQQTIEAITSTQERRTQLFAELIRVERLLVEAVDALGAEEI